MSTAAIRKVRTPEQLAALAALDFAIDDAKPATTQQLMRAFRGLRDVFTGAEVDAFSADSYAIVEAHYRGAWSKSIEPAVSRSVEMAVAEFELPGLGGIVAEYGAVRGAEWPVLMARGQVAAWSEVSSVSSEASLPDDDTRELLFLATGLSRQDAGYLARQQAAIVKSTEDSLPLVRKRIRASVQRRAWDKLAKRAEKTAEYELAKGYNDGKRLAHVQALKVGLAKEIRATWVTARDEDVCIMCRPLHNKGRVARSPSTLYNRWSDAVLSLPAHINCRCTIIYKVVAAALGKTLRSRGEIECL